MVVPTNFFSSRRKGFLALMFFILAETSICRQSHKNLTWFPRTTICKLEQGFRSVRSISSIKDEQRNRPAVNDKTKTSTPNQEIDTAYTWNRKNIFRQFRRGVGSLLSSIGFLSSMSVSLLRERGQFNRWKPTIEALQLFLKSSGIDLELSRSLNHRLFENIIALHRIQRLTVRDIDRRELALLRNNPKWLPNSDEALR